MQTPTTLTTPSMSLPLYIPPPSAYTLESQRRAQKSLQSPPPTPRPLLIIRLLPPRPPAPPPSPCTSPDSSPLRPLISKGIVRRIKCAGLSKPSRGVSSKTAINVGSGASLKRRRTRDEEAEEADDEDDDEEEEIYISSSPSDTSSAPSQDSDSESGSQDSSQDTTVSKQAVEKNHHDAKRVKVESKHDERRFMTRMQTHLGQNGQKTFLRR